MLLLHVYSLKDINHNHVMAVEYLKFEELMKEDAAARYDSYIANNISI
jgi:hypothetical protein